MHKLKLTTIQIGIRTATQPPPPSRRRLGIKWRRSTRDFSKTNRKYLVVVSDLIDGVGWLAGWRYLEDRFKGANYCH